MSKPRENTVQWMFILFWVLLQEGVCSLYISLSRLVCFCNVLVSNMLDDAVKGHHSDDLAMILNMADKKSQAEGYIRTHVADRKPVLAGEEEEE